MRFWEVGGCVRDQMVGKPSNDVDFAVEAKSFSQMRETLVDQGFEIFIENPEFVTIRAKVPSDSPLLERTSVADFVLCRKDGASSDGRRPDFVQAGDIFDDLKRRDFTMNAMAFDPLAKMLLDPHNGEDDIQRGIIRFVGNPISRIKEDGLRVMRGFRFAATLGFQFSPATKAALFSEEAAEMLSKVAVERIDLELRKMNSPESFRSGFAVLSQLPDFTLDAIFRDGLRLTPTLKEK